jgi:hypothetical protein
MKRFAFVVLLAATSGAAVAQETTPVAPEPTPAAAAIPNSTLVDDIIRLWKANLSEQFIDKYVAHSALDRDLTADDVVRLRGAGVPESLIASVTLRRAATPDRPGTTSRAAAASSGPPASSRDVRRWEGLVRRNSGVVMLKSRWDPGVLEFKDGFLRWTDARDVKKNVLVPASQITEQQLTCLKKAGGNECFEWVVKTRHEEYRFREVGWEQGDDAKTEELFAWFQGAYPSLISSRQPVDSK